MNLNRDSFARRCLWAVAWVLAAWTATSFPELFTLEREALLRGELWRLWTGHLVHGNATHFAYDVGAALLLGSAFGFDRRLLWLAPAIGLALLAAMPHVEHYYGLSAWLHGWVVMICARELRTSDGQRRGLAAGLLAGTLAKSALEAWLGRALFTAELDFGGPVLHASHLVGALVGSIAVAAQSLRISQRRLDPLAR